MRGLIVLAPIFLVVACSSAASVEAIEAEGDTGSTSNVTGSCSLTRDAILGSASSDRANAISRGFAWLDAHVRYSQTATHAGYRTDCSGFVSMSWQKQQPGYTTADYATGGGGSHALGSYDDLVPGDAIVRRSGGEGHVVLFVGWNDDAKTEACTLEEANSAQNMQFGIRTVSSLKSQGFKAIRNDDFTDDTTPSSNGSSTTTPSGDDDDTTTTTTTPADPSGSSTQTPTGDDDDDSVLLCDNDGTCNPGNDGSGMICVEGQCVPGCNTDAQCPGITVCVDGDCE